MTLDLENKKISDNNFSKHNSNHKKNETIKCQDNNININDNSYNNKNIEKENNCTIEFNKNMDKRCNHKECTKKLRISDIKCKCEFIFCSLHRLPEQHDCSFNYKSQDFNKIINNMKCISSKIEKI
jgi:predicted nucleic acid binding AN1-type Zn finger protein